MKKVILAMVLAAAMILNMVACSPQQSLSTAPATNEVSQGGATSGTTVNANSDGTIISLESGGATVSGTGAAVSGNVVTITAAGKYYVSGTLDDGAIKIDASSADEVEIVLNGASITNKTGAPIYAMQSALLTVTLADGSTNYLKDGGSSFVYVDSVEEEPNAALFSKDDIVIRGNGELIIEGGFNNGITGKDNLSITGGSISITAANHGIRGNDTLSISGGSIVIDAGDDGINSKGIIEVSGGTISISCADDGVKSDGDITVSGGVINVQKSYEGIEAAHIYQTGGVINIAASDDALNASESGTATVSIPGVASDVSIAITGGELSFVSGGDGIDSNGSISVSGGYVQAFISSSPDNGAIDADGSISMTGGTAVYGGSGTGYTASSGQYVYISQALAAGSEIIVKKGGSEVISFKVPVNVSTLAVYSPDIVSGEQYDVYSGGQLVQTVTAGQGGGTMSPGGHRGR